MTVPDMRRLALILVLFIPTVSAFSTQINFPKALDGNISTSSMLVDFDSDGLLEMIVTTESGSIHVLEANGSEVAGWPKAYSGGTNPSSPAAGNLDGTGHPEIVVVFDVISMWQSKSDVTSWRSNGASYWTYNTINNDITSSPALADLDGNGNLDVVFGSWDNNVYAFYYDGTQAWTYTTGDRIYASPAVADLNQDGKSEVLIPSSDGKLYVLFGNGSLYWNYSIGTAYYTAPAVGDLDFDGYPEIIIGSKSALYAFNYTGSVLDGWPRNDIKWGSPPALGDLDGDGKLEIVVGTRDSSNNKLYVLFENGTTKWSKAIGDEKIISSPAIADIDNDGAFDVVVATKGGTLYVYSGKGAELSSESLGPSYLTPSMGSSPAVADFDSDGDLEIMIGSYDSKVYGFDTPSTKKFVPWAMYQRDAENSGFYTSPTIKMTSPANGSVFNKSDEVAFNGTAKSPLGQSLTYEWYSDKDGLLGTGSTFNKGGLSSGIHTITLSVSDGSGNYGASYITIIVTDDLGANGSTTVDITIKAAGGDGGGGGGGGSPSPIGLLPSGSAELTSTTYSNILITLSAGGLINKDRFIEVPDTCAGPLLLTKWYPLPTDPTAAQFARTITEVTGDVYALAAEASEDISFKYGALENKLVVARGDLGVDSMAAVAYAKAKNIPILLVKPNELPSVTEEAISKMMEVRKRDIIIVGGPVAVSEEVEGKLAAKGSIRRIYGETRVGTSVALAEEAFTDKNKVRAIVITDYANPKIDAVLMSYVLDAPLLYVKSDTLSPIVKDYISKHKETIFGPTKVMLMGVDATVASEIDRVLHS